MSGNNLALVEQGQQNLGRPLSAAEVRAQVNLIQEVMSAVMKDGTHYGTIPGTQKPTLYKAGSEKILSTFRIGVDPEIIDVSTPDEIRYRVQAHGFQQSTNGRLGTGVGEASTNEERYKWRQAVCDEEWNETAEDRRRKKWQRGNKGPYQVLQIRTNPPDLANTVLKMAKKRAQIDMTLTVTGASDVFAQDIEDLPDELRDAAVEDAAPAKAPIQPPQRKESTPPAGAGTTVRVKVTNISSLTGTNAKGPWEKWTIHGSDGKKYGTFDAAFHTLAQEAREAGQEVAITHVGGKYGPDIQHLALVTREPGADDA